MPARMPVLMGSIRIGGSNMKVCVEKFIPSPIWNNIALIMKSDIDTLSMDDLYNNLKVYESEIKGQTSSSLNSQNVAFVSSNISSNTNETVNTAHSIFAASSKDQASILDNEDLEQIDADDLEEMDLKWQVVMLTMRVKRFIKKTKRKLDLNGKETIGFDRTKGNRNRDDPIRNAPVDTSTTNALVVQDGIGGYDWSFQAEEGLTNFALMAYTFQGSSSSDSEVNTGIRIQEEAKIVVSLKRMNLEVVSMVFRSRESDVDDNPVNDRFKTGEGFHAVPPPYSKNYMPPRPNLSFTGLDKFVFKSAVRKTTTSVPEIETSISKTSSCNKVRTSTSNVAKAKLSSKQQHQFQYCQEPVKY
ncbi:hypothetical protein Tco_0071099 [Tanacetum coccineum]